jgi:hypothetical protein
MASTGSQTLEARVLNFVSQLPDVRRGGAGRGGEGGGAGRGGEGGGGGAGRGGGGAGRGGEGGGQDGWAQQPRADPAPAAAPPRRGAPPAARLPH